MAGVATHMLLQYLRELSRWSGDAFRNLSPSKLSLGLRRLPQQCARGILLFLRSPMIKLLTKLRAALFGWAKSSPAAGVERKVEPVSLAINVDTSELKAALALVEQIKAASEDVNASLILAEIKGLRSDLAQQHERENHIYSRVTS